MREGAEAIRAEVRLGIDGEPVHLDIVVPDGPTRLWELWPVLQGLADLMVDVGSERAERQGRSISCREGCGACCRQPVPVAESEALALKRLVEELPEPRQSVVRARFAAAVERLEAAGLLETLRRPADLKSQELGPFSHAYFDLGLACPFLEDESCSIHAERPLACREFLVSSPAECCSTPSDETVERLTLPAGTFRAVRALDAHANASAGWTTLVLALEWSGEAPERPSLAWLNEVLSRVASRPSH